MNRESSKVPIKLSNPIPITPQSSSGFDIEREARSVESHSPGFWQPASPSQLSSSSSSLSSVPSLDETEVQFHLELEPAEKKESPVVWGDELPFPFDSDDDFSCPRNTP